MIQGIGLTAVLLFVLPPLFQLGSGAVGSDPPPALHCRRRVEVSMLQIGRKSILPAEGMTKNGYPKSTSR